MPELTVEHLSKRFAEVDVLRDVSFTVHDGEFFTLLGPSGCGKSTTLNCVAGLERPSAGRIQVADDVFVDTDRKTFLPPEARNLGMVFQSYALWPHMTVANNLALPLNIRKVGRADRNRLIDDALDKVGLLHLRDRYPHQLSGGQQQRVALARALVYSPSILLLDEPLSNLDAKLREQARLWLKRLQKDVGITTVYVTHDQGEALSLSDRIAVMSDGEMLQVGSPNEVYDAPSVPEVARFIGRCNFLAGKVMDAPGSDGTCRVKLETDDVIRATTLGPLKVGDAVTVAIRPERLTIHAGSAPPPAGSELLPATILQSSYVGTHHEYQLAVGGIVVEAESATGGLTGQVRLGVEPGSCWLYPGQLELPDDVRAVIEVAS